MEQKYSVRWLGLRRVVTLAQLIHLISMGERITFVGKGVTVYQASPTGHWFVKHGEVEMGPYTSAQEAAKAAIDS